MSKPIVFPERCLSPGKCSIRKPLDPPRTLLLGNELAGSCVPDSNKRACRRPTCEPSPIEWVLRPVNTHVIVKLNQMELGSVVFPDIFWRRKTEARWRRSSHRMPGVSAGTIPIPPWSLKKTGIRNRRDPADAKVAVIPRELEVTEDGCGVVVWQRRVEKRLAHVQQRTIGKHSRFDLNMPYLCLIALSAALKEVADAPHPFPAILNVVEKRHWDHCQVFEQG